ncbi:MAG: YwaF family protein [Lachnospiraceae bacterium]
MIKITLSVFSIAMGIGLCLFRRVDTEKKRRVFFYVSLGLIGCFVLFRIASFAYDGFVSQEKFVRTVLKSMPLHLCYLCMVLMPIALKLNHRILFAICYLLSPLAGLLALLFPDPVYIGRGYFEPTYFLFLLMHCSFVIMGIGIATSGIYTPRYADLPKTLGLSIMGICVVHGINNIFLYVFGQNPNYMYTVSTDRNPGLDFFYNILPVPLLYLVFPILIAVVTSVMQIFLFRLFVREAQDK